MPPTPAAARRDRYRDCGLVRASDPVEILPFPLLSRPEDLLIGPRRYAFHRALGHSPVRDDGSVCSPDTDTQSAAAEAAACRFFGQPVNLDDLLVGDGGLDFTFPSGVTVDVKWLGLAPSGQPRDPYDPLPLHLLIDPHAPPVDRYVVVSDLYPHFLLFGWTSRVQLVAFKKQDKGFGDRYAQPLPTLWRVAARSGLIPPGLAPTIV